MTTIESPPLSRAHADDHGLAWRDSARTVLSRGQKIFLVLLVVVAAACFGIFGPTVLLIAIIGASQLFYLAFVGVKLVLSAAASDQRILRPKSLPSSDDPDLPTITIFVPLFKEAAVLPGLVRAIDRIKYPKDRLQVMLLLEEVDDETRTAAAGADLPAHFEVVVVPDSKPRTKPKACDYGLALARGTYSVIWDAEDRPDPLQLLKAVAVYRIAPPDVVCLQARLVFWNVGKQRLSVAPAEEWRLRRVVTAAYWRNVWRWWAGDVITRMYWAEYVVHFEYILTGLARLGCVPPLGGTSNIFRTDVLRQIAMPADELRDGGLDPDVLIGAWDPWNVAEDADIAGWLARAGYRVEMIDSYTLEEASAKAKTAARQRMRWGKGYMQAGLVHMRRPRTVIRQMGLKNFLVYSLLMVGTPISLMINPAFWLLTAAYFITRSAFIESLFPPAIFYLGGATALIGNFVLLYQLMIACLRRGEYPSVKYMFLAPVWWLFTSYSMWSGVLELGRKRSRSQWHKTEHGHEGSERENMAIEAALRNDAALQSAGGL
ncbi:glycosyltransferase [Frankia sp. CNm7]|uniref:Glycosyltransferase n=1 Tax=Frankia nepalensis TaxID=1836974 RepID=A0A937RHH6_9ACTN|nr:glycosyltransferase [Frankia nepalensis]MBL7495078.1 glycosyltransferase [Frankia nepalensis]MBL7513170.1 glycosyltransferase [Frankia nepalensis]MBL7524509.1 glycosyltransferase [Frankia nepalensis]MBL7632313.1 glycosyltransferase [Frankia nepalensis]